jgi:hypothetical protein
MQGDATHTRDRGTTTARLRRAAVLVSTPIALGLLTAGCGSGSPTGGVAHLGSGTQATSAAAAGAAASSGGGESSPGSKAVAFSACMRSHGVPNFPDPQISHNGSEVSVRIALPAGVGSGNSKFKSAQQACRKLLPGGGGVGPVNQPVVSPAEQTQYLKAAACIRAHRLPNFPDPTFSGGGVHIDHQRLNESSPTFKAAVHACESLIPGGVHGGSGSTREAAR